MSLLLLVTCCKLTFTVTSSPGGCSNPSPPPSFLLEKESNLGCSCTSSSCCFRPLGCSGVFAAFHARLIDWGLVLAAGASRLSEKKRDTLFIFCQRDPDLGRILLFFGDENCTLLGFASAPAAKCSNSSMHGGMMLPIQPPRKRSSCTQTSLMGVPSGRSLFFFQGISFFFLKSWDPVFFS